MLSQANKAKESSVNFDDVSNDSSKVSEKPTPVKSTELETYYSREVKVPKKQVSIYLDEDVIKALNKWGKTEGKGAKSDLVNNFLKKTFNIRQED